MQKIASLTDRIAGIRYSGASFTLDLNLMDGQVHQVALYCLDWDGNNVRSETIEVLDAATDEALSAQPASEKLKQSAEGN
ncbi:MAG TPA: hypothetical protein VD861_14530 [Pyrinomonadaceae bacterium]|nr:hypothetical protein [Pyrinomonadaceae bacterium]